MRLAHSRCTGARIDGGSLSPALRRVCVFPCAQVYESPSELFIVMGECSQIESECTAGTSGNACTSLYNYCYIGCILIVLSPSALCFRAGISPLPPLAEVCTGGEL